MVYLSLILAVLKVINSIMDYVNFEGAKQAGRDEEIARTAAAILAKTTRGKAIMEQVNALSLDDVDRELLGLEPKQLHAGTDR
jgi:hypothetical protein